MFRYAPHVSPPTCYDNSSLLSYTNLLMLPVNRTVVARRRSRRDPSSRSPDPKLLTHLPLPSRRSDDFQRRAVRCVGGILGLYLMGLPFTISAGVGFVALAGASILEGLILVSSIRDRMAHGVRNARPSSRPALPGSARTHDGHVAAWGSCR